MSTCDVVMFGAWACHRSFIVNCGGGLSNEASERLINADELVFLAALHSVLRVLSSQGEEKRMILFFLGTRKTRDAPLSPLLD